MRQTERGYSNVSVSVVKDGGATKNGEGTTDATGEVIFDWKNAPSSEYVLTVTDVSGGGIDWDLSQPVPNTCTK